MHNYCMYSSQYINDMYNDYSDSNANCTLNLSVSVKFNCLAKDYRKVCNNICYLLNESSDIDALMCLQTP